MVYLDVIDPSLFYYKQASEAYLLFLDLLQRCNISPQGCVSDERVVVTVAHENTEKVYRLMQSQKTGISISQITRLLNGEITVHH